jgi:hypothetical protein
MTLIGALIAPRSSLPWRRGASRPAHLPRGAGDRANEVVALLAVPVTGIRHLTGL